MNISSKFSINIHFLHISIHKDKLGSELILMFSCPQDNFHNLINHIPIDHEPKAKAQDCIIDFDRVIGGYISI